MSVDLFARKTHAAMLQNRLRTRSDPLKMKVRTRFDLTPNDSGVTLVVITILLTVLLGFAALALDVSHLMVVRNELQNAADAAALAGAGGFYPHEPTSAPSDPDWAQAEGKATGSAPHNKSGGVALSDCDVESGYWNLAHTPFGLQSQGITPGGKDAPAVKVNVSRAPGKNGGPVRTFLAGILGKSGVSVSAEAIAVSASPGRVRPGAVLPVAISKEVADQAEQYNGQQTQSELDLPTITLIHRQASGHRWTLIPITCPP